MESARSAVFETKPTVDNVAQRAETKTKEIWTVGKDGRLIKWGDKNLD